MSKVKKPSYIFQSLRVCYFVISTWHKKWEYTVYEIHIFVKGGKTSNIFSATTGMTFHHINLA